MTAALAAPPTTSPDTGLDTTDTFDTADAVGALDGVDEAEFELDLRVVESTTRIVTLMCDTNDGCGSTCSTSACSTASNDPF